MVPLLPSWEGQNVQNQWVLEKMKQSEFLINTQMFLRQVTDGWILSNLALNEPSGERAEGAPCQQGNVSVRPMKK